MILLPRAVRVYFATAPANLRKSFEGLSNEVRTVLARDPSCEGELVRAPAGDKVVSGGSLGSTLVAVLVVDKYDDGLPLHRQKQRFERMGLALPVSTLADQVTWATDLLRPMWRLAVIEALGAKRVADAWRRPGLPTAVRARRS